MTIFNGIWGLLNTLLILFATVSIVKVVFGKSSNINKLMAFLLVVGIGFNKKKKEDFKYETNESGTEITTIEKISFNQDFLTENHLIYVLKSGELPIIQSALVSRNGFVSGTEWRTKHINVDNREINVLGEINYHLLGIPVFCIQKQNNLKV